MDYELKHSAGSRAENSEVGADLSLAFDVGHSSIGWAVLQTPGPRILGTGVVTFPADDCLASKRRLYRRQRRHVRSTRQRIARMEKLFIHLGIFTKEEIEAKHAQGRGHPAPWLLAARVLASRGTAEHLLTWPQLWDVLRWYAHNRGYDGNRRWAGDEAGSADGEEGEDTEKVENARALMREHGTSDSMAETITAVMYEPHGKLKALEADPAKLPFFRSKSRYKAKNAAFPREIVEAEVRRLLSAHRGRLKGVDDSLVTLLCDETGGEVLRAELRGMGIRLPKRFAGGLLFGQLVPRFDNRIISTCPVSSEKVCAKNAKEFLHYRWLMQVANVRVVREVGSTLPPQLTKDERAALHQRMVEAGAFTPGALKDAVKEISGCAGNNLETMLLHPEAAKALVLDPVLALIHSDRVRYLWPHLPERLQKRAAGKWQQGKVLSLGQILAWADEIGLASEDILAKARKAAGEAKAAKKKSAKAAKSAKALDETELLKVQLKIPSLSGRAPFARTVLRQACEEVLEGFDPRKKCLANDPTGGEDKPADGCLVTTDAMTEAALKRPLDHLTNNHLIRHRLLILQRLIEHIVADPTLVGGDARRIGAVAIEVNSELKQMSGKTAKAVAQELGQRLGNFNSVVKKLEDAGIQHPTPGLIRKARVAEDLGWTCPYTGRRFDPRDLLSPEHWDKDHIIPYSQRPSNSLDSLVITSKAINWEKKNRSALQFIEDMNRPENLARRDALGIWTPRQYKDFVSGLESWKGHDDDKKRKRRRKELLLLPKWEEKEGGFLPRDLTVTSHLTRLGAITVQRSLRHLPPHKIVSLPGSVTGALRTGWNKGLLGCLTEANPGVLEAEGNLKTKTDIRDVTHLHHALDAIVVGLALHFFPNPRDSRIWEAVVKRSSQRDHSENERLLARGIFVRGTDGVLLQRDLPADLEKEIRARLAERRVVQHLPADMSGLFVEENTRGVDRISPKGMVHLKQVSRDPSTGKLTVKRTVEPPVRLIGLRPGKLADQKGVRVITDNYGVAILDEPQPKLDGAPGTVEDRFVIIPFARVWKQLRSLRALNQGDNLTVLRQGQVIRVEAGPFQGIWKIFSVKNNASGMALDIGRADVVRLQNKTEGHKINVLLKSLVKGGIDTLSGSMTGQIA